MPTVGRTFTADDLFRLPDDGYRHELIDGELRRMTPSGFAHGVIAERVNAPLSAHVNERQLGVVCGSETGFLLGRDPDTVRAPDGAFVRHERIAAAGVPSGFWEGAPDLAIEVLSPGDTVFEIDEKVQAWLLAGACAVWVLNPKRRTVTLHRPDRPVRILTEDEVLDGDEIVPGFRLAVREIFPR